MFAAIRPSELCGVDGGGNGKISRSMSFVQSSRQFEAARQSDRVRFNPPAYAPRYEAQRYTMYEQPTYLTPPPTRELPPLPIPIPPRSSKRPMGPPVAASRSEDKSSLRKSSSRRKGSVFGIFSNKGEEQPVERSRTVSHRPTMSEPAVDVQASKLKLGRLSLHRRRRDDQPTFSMVSSSSQQTITAAPRTPMRQSTVMRRAPPRDWFPPSSSSSEEDLPAMIRPAPPQMVGQVQDHESDVSSIDDSIISGLDRTPAAAYMLNAAEEEDYSALVHSQQLQVPEVDNGNRTVWISDTDADPSTPGSVLTPADGMIFWSGEKRQEIVVQEQEVHDIPHEGWQFPARPVMRPAMDSAAQLEQLRKHSLHISTASRRTNSTTETLMSPVFSPQQFFPGPPSPPSSSEGSPVEAVRPVAQHKRMVSDVSSVAASEISERWTQTPKERLGLGGNLKRNDVLPWEEVPKEVKPRRTPRSSGVGLVRRKSNRFSAFLGWN